MSQSTPFPPHVVTTRETRGDEFVKQRWEAFRELDTAITEYDKAARALESAGHEVERLERILETKLGDMLKRRGDLDALLVRTREPKA